MEDELAHVIVDVVRSEDAVGGIMTSALINRVVAFYVHEKKQPPDENAIRKAVFDLLTREALILKNDRRLRSKTPTPQPAQKPVGTADPTFKGNASGLYPIGPGDPVFNAAGEMIAVVTNLRRVVHSGRILEIDMEVEATFTSFGSYDGTSFGGAGEVIRATPKAEFRKQYMGDWKP